VVATLTAAAAADHDDDQGCLQRLFLRTCTGAQLPYDGIPQPKGGFNHVFLNTVLGGCF
jgi:hypothetical protein